MAVSLPPEIIEDVLTRLSVKDLLRYRSVAKPWCFLIDSPDFIKKHLEHAMKSGSLPGVATSKDGDLHWINLDRPERAKKLHKPTDGYEFEIIGSCNGLLALYDRRDDVTIWNPSTKRYRTIARSGVEYPPGLDHFSVVGFGYDRVADDYKLIQIYEKVDSRGQVKIYSAKTDSWKRIQDFPFFFFASICGVLTNHALHWVVYRTLEYFRGNLHAKIIAAFDLEKEEFREVPMPGSVDQTGYLSVGVLGGLLCLTCNFLESVPNDYQDIKSDGVDIWVMKEYGVKESWTKLFSIVPSEPIGIKFRHILPVANLSDGRILLVKNGQKFITYDRKGDRAEAKDFYSTAYTDWLVCVESLVGLDGREEFGGWKARAQNKKSRRETKHDKQRRDDFLSQGFKLVL